jgi:hypothetical protein
MLIELSSKTPGTSALPCVHSREYDLFGTALREALATSPMVQMLHGHFQTLQRTTEPFGFLSQLLLIWGGTFPNPRPRLSESHSPRCGPVFRKR